jgi:ubiquinone/menaquinone biosynthesis C-methylase UbiE
VATQPQAPDTIAIKERQQKTWTSGNYAMVGNLLVTIGERLCEAVDLRAGEKILDVATGSGNTALSAARCFCEVTAIDYVPELIEQAKSRAAAERLELRFEVGDAEDLPYPDASFDVVLSTLGVMFTPNQEKAAGELLRVCRPGGKIGLANWTPEGFIGNMFRTMGKHVAPPAGIKPPPCGAPRSGCGSSWAKASPPCKRRAKSTPGGIRRRDLSSSTSASTMDRRSRLSRRWRRAAKKPWRGTSKDCWRSGTLRETRRWWCRRSTWRWWP